MPYAKTIWNPADIVTEDRWQNIEDNIEIKIYGYIPIESETGTIQISL